MYNTLHEIVSLKILFNLLIFYMSSQTPLEHLKDFMKFCSLNVPSFLYSFTQVAFSFLLSYIMTKLIFLNIFSHILKYLFEILSPEVEFLNRSSLESEDSDAGLM